MRRMSASLFYSRTVDLFVEAKERASVCIFKMFRNSVYNETYRCDTLCTEWEKQPIYSMVKLRSTWMMRRNFSILNIICIIEFRKRTSKKRVKLFAFFYRHIRSKCLRTGRRLQEAFQCMHVYVCVCTISYIYYTLCASTQCLLFWHPAKWMAVPAVVIRCFCHKHTLFLALCLTGYDEEQSWLKLYGAWELFCNSDDDGDNASVYGSSAAAAARGA